MARSFGLQTAAGVTIDFERLRLPANLLQRHATIIDAAMAEMRALEAGEIVNHDEGWQTGHYWLRAPELAPAAYRDPIRDTIAGIKAFANDQFRGKFRNILWIGIGGSGLGPQMLYDALREPGKTPLMVYFDNTDPAGFHRALAEIANNGGLQQTLTVVVSKSGGTKETRNGMLVAQQAYQRAGVEFAPRFVAITREQSELDRTAASEGWLRRFPMWDWVGGRTSVMSAVGLLPASLAGFDIDRFLAGAREMDQATRGTDSASNAALVMAAAWHSLISERGIHNLVVLPYCDSLTLLGKYLQQLIMESIGKEEQGLAVLGNKGSTDQHSFVQQLRDGRRDFFVTFLRVLDPQVDWEVEPGITAGDYLAAFQEGTEEALSDAGRPSMRLTIERMDAYALGALIALFERTVGFYASLVGINAYHQPGVEAGKKAADAILGVQRRLVERLKAAGNSAVSARELARDAKTTLGRVHDILGRLAVRKASSVTRDAKSDSYRWRG